MANFALRSEYAPYKLRGFIPKPLKQLEIMHSSLYDGDEIVSTLNTSLLYAFYIQNRLNMSSVVCFQPSCL